MMIFIIIIVSFFCRLEREIERQGETRDRERTTKNTNALLHCIISKLHMCVGKKF